jgi:uncharacterized protein
VFEFGGLLFSWDTEKARVNLESHGVSFFEAATIFGDPLAMERPDEIHSMGEQRFVATGMSRAERLLLVVHSEDGRLIRIISARPANRRERLDYEEEPI